MLQRERDWNVLLYRPSLPSHTDVDLAAICFTLTSKEKLGVEPFVRMKKCREDRGNTTQNVHTLV